MLKRHLVESRFTRPSELCPHPERWTSPDVQGTEREVTALVAAFVVALQPDFVLETGTHLGQTSEAIVGALRLNGRGRYVGLEVDARLALAATRRVARVLEGSAGVAAEVVATSSLLWEPPAGVTIDFAWFDSGGGALRLRELARYRPWFSSRCVVGVHDTAPHQGELGVQLREMQESGLVNAVFLPTPRGVAFLQVNSEPA